MLEKIIKCQKSLAAFKALGASWDLSADSQLFSEVYLLFVQCEEEIYQ